MSISVNWNGRLMNADQVRISPFDHGFLYGDGIYETLRTENGRLQDVKAHLERLRRSAAALRIDIPWNDAQLSGWSQEVADASGFNDSRIRITITRGENHFRFSNAKDPTLIISPMPMADYSPQKQSGVAVTAIQLSRILPEVKSTSLIPMILAKQAAEDHNAFECLFIDEDGYVTEGSVSNVISVKNNVVYVAPREKALPGTMQRLVLKKAIEEGYIIAEKRFSVAELQRKDEVLLANSIFGVLPIKTLCERTIKDCPGEFFARCSSIESDGIATGE